MVIEVLKIILTYLSDLVCLMLTFVHVRRADQIAVELSEVTDVFSSFVIYWFYEEVVFCYSPVSPNKIVFVLCERTCYVI